MKGTPKYRRRRGLLARLFDGIDRYVTERADRPLRVRGYEIHRKPGTRTHTYRLPIWDLRQECPLCSGTGLDGSRLCEPCDGTGVVTLDHAPSGGERR
jgi:hypothetical protein